MRRYSRITGTGSYLPPRRLSNTDLVAELAAKGVETSDEWIVERTGIRARHFAAPDVCASDLALEACKSALAACISSSLTIAMDGDFFGVQWGSFIVRRLCKILSDTWQRLMVRQIS